jgi:uncharacterized protein (TIGR02246 family)
MTDAAAAIRALRERSNAAIAARDPDAIVALMTDDVRVAVAGGPVLTGRAANRDAFAAQMAEPGFGGYVRTPTQVLAGDDPARATELGTWVGRWRVRGRVHEQRGSYRAEWEHTAVGWRLRSEVYRDDAGHS